MGTFGARVAGADHSDPLASRVDAQYCAECGQPLTVARAESGHWNAVSWRAIFLVAVGLFFVVTFGVGAWHAAEANRPSNNCPGSGEASDCAAISVALAQKLATQELPGGAALAAHLTDRDVGSDLRYAAVGLAGIVIGLSAGLLRWKRARGVGLGSDLLFGLEGLGTVVFAQLVLLGGYLLVGDARTGLPFTLANFGDDLYRALSMVFGLFGVQ